MQPEVMTVPSAQEVIDALPILAMVLDSNHRIVMANSWFANNSGDEKGECPVACYERVHATAGPHPDCPLTECIRTGKGVTRELLDTVNGRLTVTVSPFKGRFNGERLYLHLTHMG